MDSESLKASAEKIDAKIRHVETSIVNKTQAEMELEFIVLPVVRHKKDG